MFIECILYARLILGLEIEYRIQDQICPHFYVACILAGIEILLLLQIVIYMRNIFGGDTSYDENKTGQYVTE